MLSRSRRVLGPTLLTLGVGAIGGAFLASRASIPPAKAQDAPTRTQEGPRAPPRAETADEAARRALRRTPVVEAVEKAAPSVVSVGTTKFVRARFFDFEAFGMRETTRELKGLGSGVIVHSSGLVITNAHVINQADALVVRLTGLDPDTQHEIPATLLATDLDHDLALLRLDEPRAYPAATFGRSSDLMPGETVIAIGSPVGLGRTVTSGIVSALGRSVTIGQQTFEGLIQTDAAVNQGNSGGALLNILGEWIGVNSAIASLSGGGSDGISFAIPVATVKGFIARAVQTGRVTGLWSGLELADDDRGGVHVETLYPVGPAIRAGARRGSRVVAVNGRAVRSAVEANLAFVDAAQRSRIDLTVETDGERRVVTIPLEAPPTESLAWQRLGVRAEPVTQEMREQTIYPVGSGILVREVRPGSPAARVGLQPGDLLVTIGSHTVREASDLLEALQWAEKDASVPITLVRPVRARGGWRVDRWKATVVLE